MCTPKWRKGIGKGKAKSNTVKNMPLPRAFISVLDILTISIKCPKLTYQTKE